jgi:hypothetical protein
MFAEYLKCKKDIWYYLTTYWKTFDMETGKPKLFAQYVEKWDKPEYAEKLHWLVDLIMARIRARRNIDHPDLAIEKSRQMTITNTIAGICGYCICFIRDFRGLNTHEKEEKMDKPGDFNTPFGMIDYGLDNMPAFLKPTKGNLIRSHMRIGIKNMNSLIIGDAGSRPGAGGGYDLVNNTEFAHQENTNSKLAAETEACKGCNIIESTPKGKFNAHALTCDFAEKHPDKTSFMYVPFHWSLRRTKEWYEWKKLSYNGDEARIAQELDMSREGSVTGRCFKQFVPAEHVVDLSPDTFKPFIAIVGFDFGWVHDTVGLFIVPFKDDKWIVIDEHVKNQTPVHIHCSEMSAIKNKWNFEQIRYVSDPSGQARSREVGKTFWQLYNPSDKELISNPEFLPQYRIPFEAGDKVSKESINIINTMFYQSKLFINKRCVHLIDALNEAVYPINRLGQPTSETYKDDWFADPCDALWYGVSKLPKYQGIVNARQLKVQYRQPVARGLGMGNYGGRR